VNAVNFHYPSNKVFASYHSACKLGNKSCLILLVKWLLLDSNVFLFRGRKRMLWKACGVYGTKSNSPLSLACSAGKGALAIVWQACAGQPQGLKRCAWRHHNHLTCKPSTSCTINSPSQQFLLAIVKNAACSRTS